MDTKRVSRIRLAELASAVGAGYLGAGLALLWRDKLGTFAVPILVSGVVAHGLGRPSEGSTVRQQFQPRIRD